MFFRELSILMACGKKLLLSGRPAPHAAVVLARKLEGEQFMCWVGGVFDDGGGSLAAMGTVPG